MSDSQDADRAVKDPVCGKPVDPLRARAVGIYGGVTQYFCSADCKSRYADPRQQESPPPAGVERRYRDDQTGDWFTEGQARERPPVAETPERFADLERVAPEPKPTPPTPSLLVEVAATKKRGQAWLWVVLAVIAVAAISVLGLRR